MLRVSTMGSSQRCDLNTVTVVGEAAEAQSEDSDDEELREARERRALVVSRWRRAYAHVLELARLGFAGDFGSGAYIEVDLRGGKTLPPQVERKLRREYRGRVEVQVVDYCLTAARPRLVRWSNYSDGATGMRALRGFLDMPRPVLSLLEPQIRWVKAEGFAWDLVKALAGRYNLPPLLVSDLLGVENTEVLENFGAGSGVGGSGGGSSDPGPAPGGAGGFDGTWASGTSMPRGRATARSGLMGRRSRNAPAQLLSRSSQLGSGSWEKSGGVYGGGNAGDGIGGGGTDGGGGSGGSGAAGCGAWWRWGRIEKEEEPQLEDPHRRIKTEYYGSDGILYISMPMIGLRTRLLLRSTIQQQQAAAAAARAELDPAPAPIAAAAAGPTVHGARVKVEAAGGPASNAVSRALEATIAAAMRPSGGGFGGMPVAEGVEAPLASDPAAAAVASAAEAASTAGNTGAQALLARPLAPASTSVFAQNPLMSFAAAGVDPAAAAATAGHVGASSGDGGHAGLTDLGAAAAPTATRAGAATTHVTATAAGTRGPLAGAAGAALVTGASAGAAPATLVDTGTGTAAGRHHGAGGVGVGVDVGVAVGSGDVGVSSIGHPQHHPGHVHHHGHGGQRRSSELQGWGSVASGGSVADVGVETDSPRSLEAWLRWLRGLCRCGRPPSRGRKDAGLWQRLMGVRRSRDDEYRYEKRWVEEPLVLMLVQDKAVHGATPHAPPNLPVAAGPAIAAGGGGGGGGHGTGARGVTLISVFHYSGRSVTYRLWRQITSGATGSTAAAAAAAAAVAAAATAASFSHTKSGHHSTKSAAETPKSAVAVATAATGVTAGGTGTALPPHPPGVGADAGGRGGVPSGLTPQLLNRISTSTVAGAPHSLLSEVRRSDAGYLLYLIMRGAVDQAYDVVRDFYAQLSEFERRVRSGNLSATATEQLHVMSTDLQLLDRRFKATITVLRLLTTKDAKDDSGTLTDAPMQLSANTQAKIKALVEQVRGISDEIDSLGTQASQLTDLVFNLIAHRSNNSMRVLSIISTVFLPITFLAGVYGTNFDNLPELHWQLGYMYFWLLMTGVGIVVLAIANKYVH